MLALIPSSCLGLFLSLWETVIAFPEETHLIWARLRSLSFVKFLYIVSRYLGLVVHALNIAFAWKVDSLSAIPAFMCRRWLAYQIITTFIFLNAINIVLMIRVYAFYRRNWRMGAFLSAFFIARFTSATVTAAMNVPFVKFDEECGFHMPRPVVFFFLISEMIYQSFILVLTFAQQVLGSKDLPRVPTPVVSLFYRDGVISYAAIFAGLISALIYAWIGPRKNSEPFVFPVFISILTTSTCRIILNMHQLAERDNIAQAFELTATVEIDDDNRAEPDPPA
ncbi:hypothetical protein NP233_g6874 [Leucocoprinus birnbaumii]|uniref:DUF6533 domain-containing protein n=1 Tax=Leucocoprinus birnbaumii TaxID=56174 RepID=A0AAD5VSM8_9AGAR|nr:hypothetical protein NP233_g6874 [Leucocoprinus birnbaumii]